MKLLFGEVKGLSPPGRPRFIVTMMLYYKMVTRQATLESQDLSCMCLAHHELESFYIIIIISC